ncbi:Hypp5839 [Branchiostoma lanceolatum]|uniref:Hypp5839 protein n=1 Tax=Branchiostoma lanceolatum TaxID=7740 RepID=A0A8J9YP28_BRALA|nr:Hypp5839 [Branchiostoma lanceolatum]
MANKMFNNNNNNDTAVDFLSYHRFLGNHVLKTCVGGTGWLVDNISVPAQKFPPKTVLLKSSKCTGDGSIVLEPLDDANLNSAFRARHSFFRQPLASDVLDLVATSKVDYNVDLCDTVTMVTMVEGGVEVSGRPVDKMGVAFSERRRKVKGSTVKVTCKGLREIAVDFGNLANKLASLSLKANLGNEDSFLVVTHVLVADEFSWTKEKSEMKSEKYGGKLTLFPGTCLYCLLSREKETPEKHVHVVGDAILAYKLAKVKVADRGNGTISRDGVFKEGEFEGNYTFACEEVDRLRVGKYALRVTYRQDGHPRLSRSSLVFRLVGTTGTEDHTIREDGLLFSGTYRALLNDCNSGLFPLRGVRVLKVRDRPKKLMDWIRVKFTCSKDRSRLKLIKVMLA